MLKSAMLMMGGKQEDHVLRIQGNVVVSLDNGIAWITLGTLGSTLETQIPFSQLDRTAPYQIETLFLASAAVIIKLQNLDSVSLTRAPDRNSYYKIADWSKDAYIVVTLNN